MRRGLYSRGLSGAGLGGALGAALRVRAVGGLDGTATPRRLLGVVLRWSRLVPAAVADDVIAVVEVLQASFLSFSSSPAPAGPPTPP